MKVDCEWMRCRWRRHSAPHSEGFVFRNALGEEEPSLWCSEDCAEADLDSPMFSLESGPGGLTWAREGEDGRWAEADQYEHLVEPATDPA